MPIKRTYRKRAAPAKKRTPLRSSRYRKRAVYRNRANDVAGVSETIPFQVSIPGVVSPTATPATFLPSANNIVWTMTDTTLASFTRAQAVAQNYQYYKLKYFELKILPGQDTFTPGSASAKPYFYYQIDKGNTLPVWLTMNNMKAMGCKPIALDEKPIVIRWKPGISLSTEISTSTGTTSAQMYRISPWLNCDENSQSNTFQPSQVVHNGLKVFAENDGTSLTFRGSLTAHFVFKKPAIQASG